jgi:hypothetical protein
MATDREPDFLELPRRGVGQVLFGLHEAAQ